MNHLNHIIENVRTEGFHEESWHVLNSAYFPGEDARYRARAWANANGMIAFFDYNGGQPSYFAIQLVSFHRSRSAK